MNRFLPLVFITSILFLMGVFYTPARNYLTNLKRAEVGEKFLTSEAHMKEILTSKGEFDTKATEATYDNKKVVLPTQYIADVFNSEDRVRNSVLGQTSEEKWIEVDLSEQKLFAYEGKSIKHIFAISSGNPWTPTVTGEFYVWGKVRSQRMSGGSLADGSYYNLPNVPYVMYFYKGYSFHGAYWHNDFGKPRSHGCVNLSIADSQTLYYWAYPEMATNQNYWYQIPQSKSTRVVVHGTTPPRT